MDFKNKKQELLVITSIMSYHIGDALFVKHNMHFIESHEIIVSWAREFQKIHNKTNWDFIFDQENTKIQPLSKAYSDDVIITWDEVIEDYIYYKLENFNNDTKS